MTLESHSNKHEGDHKRKQSKSTQRKEEKGLNQNPYFKNRIIYNKSRDEHNIYLQANNAREC